MLNHGGLVISEPLSKLSNSVQSAPLSRAARAECGAAMTGRADMLHFLGLQSLAAGDSMRAVMLLERASRCDVTNMPLLNNLGVALIAAREAGRAAACLRKVATSTDLAEPSGNLGIALQMLGDLDDAAACLSRAIAMGGGRSLRLFRRRHAELLVEQGCFAEAESALRALLDEDSFDTESLLHLGQVLAKRREWQDAVQCFDCLLAIQPGHLGALCALSEVVDDDRVAGLANLLQSAQTKASDPDAQYEVHRALARLSRLRRDVGGEIQHYRRALEYRPGAHDAEVELAKALLLSGDFGAGWSAFEWRWRQKPAAMRQRGLSKPRWHGQALGPCPTILLHAEQGFGSIIQFARYAPLVTARGGRVVLEVPRALVRLMSSLAGVERIVACGEPIPALDWQCPLMSLPLAFETRVSSIPAPAAYLAAEPAAARAWSERLPKQFRAGVVWAGAPAHYNDRRRSMPAAALAPLTELTNIAFVSLQPESSHRTGEAPPGFIDAAAGLTDFADTAAVIASLDLVITVDTAVAHLAGALGKPVWILLPFAGEYRWLLNRGDSPWYPTATLFRQPHPGDWSSVIARVLQQLRAVAAGDER